MIKKRNKLTFPVICWERITTPHKKSKKISKLCDNI